MPVSTETSSDPDQKTKTRFNSPHEILIAWSSLREQSRIRGESRSKIAEFFAGDPPYSEQEAEEIGLETNVNWMEPASLLHKARQKYHSAFLNQRHYLQVRLNQRGIEKSKLQAWGIVITEVINKKLKRSLEYTNLLQNLFASGCLHALGVSHWPDYYDWCPEFVALEDFEFPSRTFNNLKNLDYFGIYRRYTYSELKEAAEGPDDAKWNNEQVQEFLDWLLEQEPFTNAVELPSYLEPEFYAQDRRENAAWYRSDIVPTIKCIDFYFKDTDGKWKRRIVPDYAASMGGQASIYNDKPKFLYEDDDVAESHEQIIHLLITDLLNTPPFRLSLVRGLGHMLYAPLMVMNRLRSKLSDSAFTNLLEMFRNTQSDDQERLQKVDLYNYGVVPDGLSWVTGQERHKPDFNLIAGVQGQIQQIVSEIAASFRTDPDDGTNKEMTAREVMVRVNQASAMVGSMLNDARMWLQFQHQEICRRFCMADSPNEDVKAFREEMEMAGVPEEMLDIEKWEISTTKPIGNGIKALELAQSEQLMAVRGQLDPTAQKKVLHMFVQANTEDPDMAMDLVPLDENDEPSSTGVYAPLAYATLMEGIPFVIPRDISSLLEFAINLVRLLSSKVQETEQSTGMATPEQLKGFQAVYQFCLQLVNQLANDEPNQEVVRKLSDMLGQIGNGLKAFAQRLEEKMKSEQGNGAMTPEIMQKMMSAMMDSKLKEAAAQQKMRHMEEKFQREQERRDAEAVFNLQRKGAEAQTEIEIQDAKAAAEIGRNSAMAQSTQGDGQR